RYKLRLEYDQIPHFISDSVQTPYFGTGSDSLTLPAGFAAPTTALMPLPATLRYVDLATDRKRLGVGGSWLASPNWQYSVGVRHEIKEGSKRTAGAFFVNAAQLVEPVDYVTDQIDASVSYSGARLQAKLSYYGSLFRNRNDALTWQNPYTGLPAAPAIGQLALAPDNQFHQILAAVAYQFTDRVRATADLALGRMTQDETFLAPTVNAALAVPALPRGSLDGEATTLNANVKLNASVTNALRLNAAYSHNKRDNDTPQASYAYVITDQFPAAPRINLPYSFTQDKVKVSADYRATATMRASLGFDHDEHKRTFQEAEKTREDTIWGKVAYRVLEKVDLSLKLEHAERRHSGYAPLTFGGIPLENPLLRKYTLANRDRDNAALRADIAFTDNVNLGLGMSNSSDDYSDSPIGLTSGRQFSLNGDLSIGISEKTTLHFFANHERIRSRQTNSQTFSAPDWIGDNEDMIDFYGLGLRHAAIKNKLDIGADFGYTRTRSNIRVDTGTGDADFPSVRSKLESVKLYATYKLKDNVSVNATYWYDRFTSSNWMLEGVAPGTIPNVLTFGEVPPRYSVNFVTLSVRYKF
ncbi:MAG: MtrB/PioB family decaheme-associated outer membrane protein, partial [Burkholderiales bacterium]